MIDRSSSIRRSELIEIKQLLLEAMSGEQKLYLRRVDELREESRWRERANLAISRSAEDLARGALARAGRHAATAAQFHAQYQEQKGYLEGLKRRLLELQSGSGERPSARPVLSLQTEADTLGRLDRLSDAAFERGARQAALAELERDVLSEKLSAMEREDQVERQLAELKRTVGQGDLGPRE